MDESKNSPTGKSPMMPDAQLPKPPSKKKKIWLGVVGFVCLLITKYVVSFLSVESEVQMSKYGDWDDQFKKSFVESCSQTSHTNMLEQITILEKYSAVEADKISEKYGDSYCQCITDKIEKKNILATKYNKLKGEKAYEDESSKAIHDYMESSDGQAAIHECVKVAEDKADIHLSEEEYFTASCAASTIEEVVKQAQIDPNTLPQKRKKQINNYAIKYCDCVATKAYPLSRNNISKQQRAPTSSDELSELVGKYLDGPEGKKLMTDCGNIAKKELN